MRRKPILVVTAVIILVLAFIGFNFYLKVFGVNTIKKGDLYITSTDSFQDLSEKLAPFVKDVSNFNWVANQKKFTKPKSGRYVIQKNMSNNELVNLLRSGRQTPVNVSFNNQDTLEKFAGRVAEQLEIDSISTLLAFRDELFLDKHNFTEKSVLQICIPNTYQLYWDVSATEFRDRMLAEYQKFWNDVRIAKAKALNLTKNEVITLASIVQKETAKKVERPIVAGLYLNRLQKGWPLQADPTVIYAIKEVKGQDYVVKRVLYADLEINSPYNTYKNAGLPPSLISMPDISSIDGVLNAEKHNYYFMCVDVTRFGYHKFAETQAQHNRNAAKYHQWLNEQGINR